MSHDSLTRTCKAMIDSLLAGRRHTLCLNIAEPGFAAETVALDYLHEKGHKDAAILREPTPTHFEEAMAAHTGVAVVWFEDLDKHGKCLDLLVEHARKPDAQGKLVVVSPAWISDNTAKERELRDHCLFYQQNVDAQRKTKTKPH